MADFDHGLDEYYQDERPSYPLLVHTMLLSSIREFLHKHKHTLKLAFLGVTAYAQMSTGKYGTTR